jgi:predicted transcriptional regulator
MRIFLLAEKGISNSNKAIKELDLTPKRYYSRLKDLVDRKVLEKVNGVYVYTALGEAVSRLGIYMMQVLDNKERFVLINQLNKNKSLSSTDIDQIKDVIFQQSGVLEGALHLILDGKNVHKMDTFSNYEKGVEKLVERINLAQERIFLASRYFDSKVIEATLKARKRGVKLRVIMAKENITKKIDMLKMFLSPKLIMALIEFADQGVDQSIRETDLDYSYCIIDHDGCFFEFPSLEDKFSIGFFVIENKINNRFNELFNIQWEKSESKKMPELFNKLKEFKG